LAQVLRVAATMFTRSSRNAGIAALAIALAVPAIGCSNDGRGGGARASGPKFSGEHYRNDSDETPDCALGWFKGIHFRTKNKFSGIIKTCLQPGKTLPNGIHLSTEIVEDGVEGTFAVKKNGDNDFRLNLTFQFDGSKRTYATTFGDSGNPNDGLFTMLLIDAAGKSPTGFTAEAAVNHMTNE
jgi:hypothetical protein